jgi:hypothetical protein
MELWVTTRASLGSTPNTMRVMANAPAVLDRYLVLSAAFAKGRFNAATREWVAVGVAAYCSDHCPRLPAGLHGTHQTPSWPSQSQETPGLPCDPPVRHARIMNESNGPSATSQRDVKAVSGVLRELEGREVSLSLADGSRLDCVMLISAGRGRTPTVWFFANGIDVFLPRLSIIAAWEAPPANAARRAA